MSGLARDLTLRYGRGYTRRALYKYLQFYRAYPEIVPSSSAQFGAPLTWSHYEELLRVADPSAREWYEREASAQTWSVRTLRRNINTQYKLYLPTEVQLRAEIEAQKEIYLAQAGWDGTPPHDGLSAAEGEG